MGSLGQKLIVFASCAALIIAAALASYRRRDDRGGYKQMSTESVSGRLELGHPVVRDLAGGETQSSLVRLELGQYVRLAAEQRGIDVKLRLYAPDDRPITEVDSPNGIHGAEQVSEVAQSAGDYRVEVLSDSASAKPGQYELRIEELRPATDQDRVRVQAERIFTGGERRRRAKEWENAEASYRQALVLHRSLGDRAGEATDVYRIGWMHERLGEARRAIDFFDQALPIFQEVGDRYSEGMVLNRRGRIQHELGDAAASIASHQEALARFRAERDPFAEAITLNNLGNAYSLAGKAGLALAAYQEAQDTWKRLENRKEELKTSLNLGDLYVFQDKRQEARDAFESALRNAQALQTEDLEAVALSSLGELEHRDGRFQEAKDHLLRALDLQKKLQDIHEQAITQVSLATVYIKEGDLEKARLTGEEALGAFRKLSDRRGEGFALATNLGRYHLAKGEPALALERLREAMAIFERTGDRQGIALARHASGQALAKMGDLEGARKELEQALDTVEGLRMEAPSLDLRASYFASRQEYWDTYIDVLMRMHEINPSGGFDALALQAAERRRARSLLDALAEAEGDVQSGADPQILSEIQSVQQAINSTHRKRLEFAGQKESEGETRELERRQRALLVRLDALRTEMRSHSPHFSELTDPQPLDTKLIRDRLLDPSTLLLVYSLGETRSVLWAVGKGYLASHSLPERSRIEPLAQQVHDLLPRRGREAQERRERRAEALSNLVLGPVAEDLWRYKRILVVADGALQLIPFATLPEPGVQPPKLLVEGHEIIHLPSASVLATLRRKARGRKPGEKLRVTVIADPVFQADDPRVTGGIKEAAELPVDLARSARSLGLDGFERLPYTREEAKAILDLVEKRKGTAFRAFDFDANRELLTEDSLRDAHILHIATHSLLDARQPELSGIVFSLVDAQGRPRDGFLRLHEIYNLSLKADLVVLSACQTGVGKELRGEGLMGITRGFMHAGVPQVVVSLWKVDDRSTAELMKRFYHYILEEGQPPAAALRSAQHSMLEDPEWSEPWHWGGFIYQGDYRARPGGVEEQDAGGSGTARKANSDMPPPDVPPDRPPVRKPRPPKMDTGKGRGLGYSAEVIEPLQNRLRFVSFHPPGLAPGAWAMLLVYFDALGQKRSGYIRPVYWENPMRKPPKNSLISHFTNFGCIRFGLLGSSFSGRGPIYE